MRCPRPPVRWRARLAVVLGVAAMTAAGCGGDDPHTDEIAVVYPSAPDSLDPAMSVTSQGWNALWRVYTPPLTYASDDTRLVPGVAAALPSRSADGRTYALTIDDDARFADGRRVRPSDVEHTIVRVLRMGSPGAPLFLGIVGAEAVLEKRTSDITGVEADEADGTVTFRLARADSTFPYALATSYAGVVPADTPMSDQSTTPPPGAGPYSLAVTRVTRGFALRPVGGDGRERPIRVRYLVRGEAQVGAIGDGTADIVDQPTPGDALNEFRRTTPAQDVDALGAATSMFFLNVRTPPFDDPRVRQAAALAVDPNAAIRLYAGLLDPGCELLPPAVAPVHSPCRSPDVARARQLVRDAGADGAKVRVWGPSEGPDGLAASYLADALTQVGLRARPTTIAAATYFGAVSRPATHAQAGVLSWAPDYPHPASMLRLVDGDELGAASTTDVSNVRDRRISRGIDELASHPLTPEAKAAYGALADRAVREAYVIPYGHGRREVLRSTRVPEACLRVHPILGPDPTSLCIR